jgi:hypothetical protein
MLSSKQKAEKLAQAVREFHGTQKTADDYLNLFVVVQSCLKQGDGLVWETVIACINEALEEKN